MTTPELDNLLTMLRRHGVQEYADGTLRVVLAPDPPPAAPSAMTPDLTQAVAPQTCPGRCPHPRYDHSGDVGCMHGCPPELCVPEGVGS